LEGNGQAGNGETGCLIVITRQVNRTFGQAMKKAGLASPAGLGQKILKKRHFCAGVNQPRSPLKKNLGQLVPCEN